MTVTRISTTPTSVFYHGTVLPVEGGFFPYSFFSESPTYASRYAEKKSTGGRVYPVKLSIHRPANFRALGDLTGAVLLPEDPTEAVALILEHIRLKTGLRLTPDAFCEQDVAEAVDSWAGVPEWWTLIFPNRAAAMGESTLFRYLEKWGYDGATFTEGAPDEQTGTWVIFHPEQVTSTLALTSPADPGMYEAL